MQQTALSVRQPTKYCGRNRGIIGLDLPSMIVREVFRCAVDPALEESRGGGGPGDGVPLLVPADALEGKRCSHEVRSTARMIRTGYARCDLSC